MADNTMIKVAAVGAAVYVAYTQGWLSFLGIGTAAPAAAPATTGGTPAAAPTPAATPVVAPTVDPKANVLDGIYARMVAAAKAPSQGLGMDAWGYYLNQQLAPLNLQAPDPMPLFQAYATSISPPPPGGGASQPVTFDRATYLFTAPAYWGVMAPALQSQLGLSGLGVIGGLASYWRTN